MTEKLYDIAGYASALEKILESASRDYWVQYVDINRHQVGVAKTYLWVAAALMGGYVATFKIISFEGAIYPPSFITFYIIAFLLAIAAFGFCLYAIPARTGYRVVAPNSWGEFSKNAHQRFSKKEPNLYISTLTELIDKTDAGAFHNLNTNKSRAKLLRITSWLLLASFLMALFVSISFGAANIELKLNKEEILMIEENNSNDGDSSSQNTDTSSEAEAPQVPTPQGPLGSGDQNVHTHSVDREPGSVTMTEGVEEKSDE